MNNLRPTTNEDRARRRTLYDSPSARRIQDPPRASPLLQLKRKQLDEQHDLGEKHRHEALALEERQRQEANRHVDVVHGGAKPREMHHRHEVDRQRQRDKHAEERAAMARRHDAEIGALDRSPGR